MSIPSAWPQVLDFFGTPLVIESSPGQLSSGTGLLPIRQFDERIGLTQAYHRGAGFQVRHGRPCLHQVTHEIDFWCEKMEEGCAPPTHFSRQHRPPPSPVRRVWVAYAVWRVRKGTLRLLKRYPPAHVQVRA